MTLHPLPAALLAAVLLCPACDGALSPSPPPGPEAVPAGRREEWAAAESAAQRDYEAGRWDESAARNLEKIALYPSAAPGAPLDEGVESLLQRDLYNLACCRALAGKKPEALEALERSFRDGGGAIDFDHLVQDPDLESLHGEERWKALVYEMSNCYASNLYSTVDESPQSVCDSPPPVVVELLAPDVEAAAREKDDFPEWIQHGVLIRPRPPYRAGRQRLSWTTRLDAGEHACKFAVQELDHVKGLNGWLQGEEPKRRILKASGPEMVRVAWEILLRRPEVFTHAVLDGPAPPARMLLDRGAEKVKAAIFVADAKGVPDARVGVKVEVAGSADEALARALR